MEQEGVVFEADANVGESLRQRPSASDEDLHCGTAATTAANGGIHNKFDESTPLLSERQGPPPSYSSSSHDGNTVPYWPGKADFEGLPWWRTPSIYWMLGPFLLFALAFGTIIVPKTNLMKELICRDFYTERLSLDPNFTFTPIKFGQNDKRCDAAGVQEKAALFILGTSLVSALLAAISSPKIGELSDRYGRIAIISITACGSLLGEVLTILAATYPDTFNVNWLYVSFALEGLTGSFIAGMAIAHAYAVDCTPPAKRNVAFGYFHGCLFIGIAIGPVLGGSMVKATGDRRSVFFLALACHLFFISFVGLVVPESLSKRRQLLAREKRAVEFAKRKQNGATWATRLRKYNLLEPLKILYPTGPGTSSALRRNLVLLAAIDTTMFGVAMGSVYVMLLYMAHQFHWQDFGQSIVISIINVCRSLGLFVALPIIVRIVRGPSSTTGRQRQTGCDGLDLAIIRIATIFDTIGYLGFTLVRTGPLFVLSGVVASFGGVGSPTLQSSLTKHVPADRVGQLLGAVGLLHALARVAATTICPAIYSSTVATFPQAIFAVLAAGFGFAALMTWFLKSHVYMEEGDSNFGANDVATAEGEQTLPES